MQEAVARLLVEKEAAIDLQDTDWWTALHTAAWSGHEATAQLLLENGAAIDL
jgi:ankyrin repeat protein